MSQTTLSQIEDKEKYKLYRQNYMLYCVLRLHRGEDNRKADRDRQRLADRDRQGLADRI
jgi:hypothetical protein